MAPGMQSLRLLRVLGIVVASLALPTASITLPSAHDLGTGPGAYSHRSRDLSLPLSLSNGTNALSANPDIAFKDAIKLGEKYAIEHIDSQSELLYIIADWGPPTPHPKNYPHLGMAFKAWPPKTKATEEYKIDDNIWFPLGTDWIGPSPWPKTEVEKMRKLTAFRATDVGVDLDTAWKMCVRNKWVWGLHLFTVVRKTMWEIHDIWYQFYVIADHYPVIVVGSRSGEVRLLLGPTAADDDDDISSVGWISGDSKVASNQTAS